MSQGTHHSVFQSNTEIGRKERAGEFAVAPLFRPETPKQGAHSPSVLIS